MYIYIYIEKKRERRGRRTRNGGKISPDKDMLLPSKLVCHRDRLSQPALMSKIVSVYGARENEKRDERNN